MAKGREDFFCCLTMYLSRDGSLTQPSKKGIENKTTATPRGYGQFLLERERGLSQSARVSNENKTNE